MPAMPTATALVVVDMQVAFVSGADASPQMPTVLPAVKTQVSSARAVGALVIFLQNDGPQGAADEMGSQGWELALATEPSDVVIRKREDSGFVGTTLEELLRQRKVGAVSICGVMSEMCVAATSRDAMERGFDVVLAHDSHGTYPVPAYADGEVDVSAAQAARAAEWSLGDTMWIPATASDVSLASAVEAE